jgi:hypothetical protein
MQLAVPDNYGYVILGSLVAHFGVNMVLGSSVMSARKKFNVQVCVLEDACYCTTL